MIHLYNEGYSKSLLPERKIFYMCKMKEFKKEYSLICCISITLVLFLYGSLYANENRNLRVPVGDYTRVTQSLLDSVLDQISFPDESSRKILTNMGITIEAKNSKHETISIDLSWAGINDDIIVEFIKRDEFIKLSKYPFIREINSSNKSITYKIPEDITLRELSYLIENIDSQSAANKLKLSNIFTMRYKTTAVYLANNIAFDRLSEPVQNKLKGQIEVLYALGNMFSNDEFSYSPARVIPFEKIQKQEGYQNNEAVEEYLNSHLNISTEVLKTNPDKVIQWSETIMDLIKEDVRFIKTSQLEHKIFNMGIEDLYGNLKAVRRLERLRDYFERVFSSKLLKDKLPIEKWRNRLKNAGPAEEIRIIRQVLKVIEKYPLSEDGKKDWIVKYVLHTNELHCVARAILTARILIEIGIEKERIYSARFPVHIFLILEQKNGAYIEIETHLQASKRIRLLPETRIYEIRKKIGLRGTISMRFNKELREGRIETKYLNISLLTEGLMAVCYLNLEEEIENQLILAIPYEEQIKIFDIQIRLLEKAAGLNKNDVAVYLNLTDVLRGKAMLIQSDNIDGALILLDKSINMFLEAVKLNPVFALTYKKCGAAFVHKAQLITYKDPKEALMCLNQAIDMYKEALRLSKDAPDIYYDIGIALSNKAVIIESENPKDALKFLNEAISLYEKATEGSPKLSADAYYYCGNALYQSSMLLRSDNIDRAEKLLDQAIDKYRKSVAVYNDYGEVYHNLADALVDKAILVRSKDNKQALKLITEAISKYRSMAEIFKDDEGLYYSWGIAIYNKSLLVGSNDVKAKLLKEAIEKYNKTLSINPKHTGAQEKLIDIRTSINSIANGSYDINRSI